MINLSYSKIPLADVAVKLQLDSAEDAEYIVAKVGYLDFFDNIVLYACACVRACVRLYYFNNV